MSKEEVETIFNEAKSDIRNYFISLSDNSFNFEEFQLQYDNSIRRLILFVKNIDGSYGEINRWNFNITMFKELITLANQFDKNSDNFDLWDRVPILISMRV